MHESEKRWGHSDAKKSHIENDWTCPRRWRDTSAYRLTDSTDEECTWTQLCSPSRTILEPETQLSCICTKSGILWVSLKQQVAVILFKGRKSQQPYLTLRWHSLCAGSKLDVHQLDIPQDIKTAPLTFSKKRKEEGGKERGGRRQKEEIVLLLQDGIRNKVEIQNKYWTTCKLLFPGTFLLALGLFALIESRVRQWAHVIGHDQLFQMTGATWCSISRQLQNTFYVLGTTVQSF